MEQRWVNEQSSFNFTFRYQQGRLNIGADALFRLPGDAETMSEEDMMDRWDIDSQITTILQATPLSLTLQEVVLQACCVHVNVVQEDLPTYLHVL